MMAMIPDGEERFRLLDADGQERGWIRGRALRFAGFASEVDVMEAAKIAWQVLESVLRGQAGRSGRWLPRLEGLRLVHDGAYEWISDGRIPIARIYRPPADAVETGFAIELVVPSYAADGTARQAAVAIAEALGGRNEQPLPAA